MDDTARTRAVESFSPTGIDLFLLTVKTRFCMLLFVFWPSVVCIFQRFTKYHSRNLDNVLCYISHLQMCMGVLVTSSGWRLNVSHPIPAQEMTNVQNDN